MLRIALQPDINGGFGLNSLVDGSMRANWRWFVKVLVIPLCNHFRVSLDSLERVTAPGPSSKGTRVHLFVFTAS